VAAAILAGEIVFSDWASKATNMLFLKSGEGDCRVFDDLLKEVQE